MTASTKTTVHAPVNFKDDVRQLADKIAAKFTVEKGTGVLALPANTFIELAPEGVTSDSYKVHRHYDDTFMVAAQIAGLERSVDIFKDDKKIDTTQMSVPTFGKDSIDLAFARQGSYVDMATKETVTYAGAITARKFTRVSTRTAAEEKLVKTHLKALAAAAGI